MIAYISYNVRYVKCRGVKKASFPDFGLFWVSGLVRTPIFRFCCILCLIHIFCSFIVRSLIGLCICIPDIMQILYRYLFSSVQRSLTVSIIIGSVYTLELIRLVCAGRSYDAKNPVPAPLCRFIGSPASEVQTGIGSVRCLWVL